MFPHSLIHHLSHHAYPPPFISPSTTPKSHPSSTQFPHTNLHPHGFYSHTPISTPHPHSYSTQTSTPTPMQPVPTYPLTHSHQLRNSLLPPSPSPPHLLHFQRPPTLTPTPTSLPPPRGITYISPHIWVKGQGVRQHARGRGGG